MVLEKILTADNVVVAINQNIDIFYVWKVTLAYITDTMSVVIPVRKR